MTEETAEEKLARYEFVLDAYVRELTTLREENARLREGANALATLQNIYRNCDLPESLRTKAAGLALQHEVPRLMPERAPLELTAEPYEPLADVVARQRARADRIRALPLAERERMVRGVTRDDGNGSGNGSND